MGEPFSHIRALILQLCAGMRAAACRENGLISKPFAPQGSPRGQGPPRMRSLHRRKAMPSACQENGLISKPFPPQGSPRGQGPPRMRCLHRRKAMPSPCRENGLISKPFAPQGEPEGARPASDEIFASPQGDAPVTPPALPRCGSRRGSICRSAAAADTERSARSRRWT